MLLHIFYIYTYILSRFSVIALFFKISCIVSHNSVKNGLSFFAIYFMRFYDTVDNVRL